MNIHKEPHLEVAFVLDSEPPAHLCANILSTRLSSGCNQKKKKRPFTEVEEMLEEGFSNCLERWSILPFITLPDARSRAYSSCRDDRK
jgi:hypothetical protein